MIRGYVGRCIVAGKSSDGKPCRNKGGCAASKKEGAQARPGWEETRQTLAVMMTNPKSSWRGEGVGIQTFEAG